MTWRSLFNLCGDAAECKVFGSMWKAAWPVFFSPVAVDCWTGGQQYRNLDFWQWVWSILQHSFLLSLLQPCGDCCVGSASWHDTCLFSSEINPLSKYTTTLLWSQGTFKHCRIGGCSLWSLKPSGGCWIRATVPQSSTLSVFGQLALNREGFEDLNCKKQARICFKTLLGNCQLPELLLLLQTQVYYSDFIHVFSEVFRQATCFVSLLLTGLE